MADIIKFNYSGVRNLLKCFFLWAIGLFVLAREWDIVMPCSFQFSIHFQRGKDTSSLLFVLFG
jgi:hypothetical protein